MRRISAIIIAVLILFTSLFVPGTGSAAYAVSTTIGSGFNLPYGVAVDGTGNIYVTNYGNNTITKMNGSGAVDDSFASPIYPELNGPKGIAVDNGGNIYVANYDSGNVKKFSSNGSLLSTFTFALDSFSYPTGVAVDNSGYIYVAFEGDDSVKKIDCNNGTVIASWGGFHDPQCFAIDSSGNFYVANYQNDTITKMSSSGSVEGTFDYTSLPSPRYYSPVGVAIDGSGSIYVSFEYNGKILKIDSNGAVDDTFTSPEFTRPQGIAFDSSGNLYVADYSDGTVTKIGASAPTPEAAIIIESGTSSGFKATYSGSVAVDNAATLNAAIMAGINAGGSVVQFGNGSALTVPTVDYANRANNSLPSATYKGAINSGGNNPYFLYVTGSSTVTLDGLTANCDAANGDLIRSDSSSTVNISNSTLTSTGSSSTVIGAYGSALNISDGIFTNTSSAMSYCYLVTVSGSCNANITGGTFTNTANAYNGSGIRNAGSGSLSVSGITITTTNNSISNEGSGHTSISNSTVYTTTSYRSPLYVNGGYATADASARLIARYGRVANLSGVRPAKSFYMTVQGVTVYNVSGVEIGLYGSTTNEPATYSTSGEVSTVNAQNYINTAWLTAGSSPVYAIDKWSSNAGCTDSLGTANT